MLCTFDRRDENVAGEGNNGAGGGGGWWGFVEYS